MDDLYVVRFDVTGGLRLDQPASTSDHEDQEEDRNPDEKTTFAQFGLAYYQASVLEHEVVNLLAVMRLVAARDEAEKLLADPWSEKFKKTMGALLKQLAEQLQDDADLAADLAEALRLRNHLAHAFWRERAEDFCTDLGRSQMIDFLIDARRLFQDVDRRLTETHGAAALEQWGVTPAVVQAWYEDALAKASRGESSVPLETLESTRRALLARVKSSNGP
jgi:hypothetical protein